MAPSEIRYTAFARTFLGGHVSAFEEQFHGELAESMGEEGEAEDLLFHSLEFAGRLYAGTWHENGWLMIDSATEEETTVKTGPNTGQKIILPQPDSR